MKKVTNLILKTLGLSLFCLIFMQFDISGSESGKKVDTTSQFKIEETDAKIVLFHPANSFPSGTLNYTGGWDYSPWDNAPPSADIFYNGGGV